MGQLMVIGRTVRGPKVPTLKGTETSLSYIQCLFFVVSSSINVSIFHITWLDTFWTDLGYRILTGLLLVFSSYYPFSLVTICGILTSGTELCRMFRIIQGAIDMRIDCLLPLSFYNHSEYVSKEFKKIGKNLVMSIDAKRECFQGVAFCACL